MKKRVSDRKRKKRILLAACVLSAVVLALSICLAVSISDRLNLDRAPEKKEPTLSYSFDPEILVYNGDGNLDVLYGVTVTDKNGEKYDGKITASIKGSGSGYKIRYSINEKGGAISTAERILQVENYAGPSVSFKETNEKFLSTDLDRLVDRLVSSGNLSALDGFGHDISGSIVMNIDSLLVSSGDYTVTFTAENVLGDKASCVGAITIELNPNDKLILLSERNIRIPVGKAFDPYTYLVKVYDPIDGDVTSKVIVSGNVNTMSPGKYEVTYSFTNSRGEVYPDAVLTVTVTE